MNFKEKLNKVKAFAFDVDGVFTDGTVYLMPGSREFMRAVNIKDGYAVQHAVKAGYKIAIISGGKSEAIRERFTNLGVQDIFLSSSYKMDPYREFKEKYGLTDDEILYMGDDLPDYEVMNKVGIATCPSDAAYEIKELSIYVSPSHGGKGCVRDVIEQVLRLQDKWMNENTFKW
ncbi:MAG: HAD-IIIA family hydrolase [Bacteroidales bacterium]|nr:HAD-IIIA family hydrolase [Bacteroidales bacterium]